MGAGNVARALAVWGSLPDREMRLLLAMAVTALDDDGPDQPAREFFAGRDFMAFALGRDPDTDPEAYRAVKRAVRGLVEAGAIERTTHAHSGNRQVYRLILDTAKPDISAVDNVIPLQRKGAT